MNSSSRAMPLLLIARPTASSFRYDAAVSIELARRQGVRDRLLGLVVRDLEDTESEDRHLDPVVQRDRPH